jgi:GNAT superfamily N-acetyltransferase
VEIRERQVVGLEYLELMTELLQRLRLSDPTAGLWEAADLQWWWRSPRSSDQVEKAFWLDSAGPVAAVVLTDWGRSWGCDPIVLPNLAESLLPLVWSRAVSLVDVLDLKDVQVLALDDDSALLRRLRDSGFRRTAQQSMITWMRADDRPAVHLPPAGFRVLDRVQAASRPHHLVSRHGAQVELRLRQCSLYESELDLSVEAPNGDIAGYGLFWFDPVTKVGLVEPMRTEHQYQRLGLARAVLTAGLDRLAKRGATRLKVGYETDDARDLYLSAGFRLGATSRNYTRRRGRPGT